MSDWAAETMVFRVWSASTTTIEAGRRYRRRVPVAGACLPLDRTGADSGRFYDFSLGDRPQRMAAYLASYAARICWLNQEITLLGDLLPPQHRSVRQVLSLAELISGSRTPEGRISYADLIQINLRRPPVQSPKLSVGSGEISPEKLRDTCLASIAELADLVSLVTRRGGLHMPGGSGDAGYGAGYGRTEYVSVERFWRPIFGGRRHQRRLARGPRPS